MRKIPRTAKLDEAVGRVQFGSPRNFLNPIISKLDKHVVLLPINYIVYYLRVKKIMLILSGIYYFKISSVSKLIVILDRYPNIQIIQWLLEWDF